MQMIKAINIGYLLVGTGIGLIGSSLYYGHELRKPIGEIDEYIPLHGDGNDISTDTENRSSNKEFSSSSNGLLHKNGKEGRDDSTGTSGRVREGEHGRGGSSRQEFGTDQNHLVNVYGQREKDIPQQLGKNSFVDEVAWKNYEKQRRTKRDNDKPYSQMYKRQENSSDMIFEEEIDTSMMGVDSPPDDEVDLPEFELDVHDEYTLERVEENFEIFLGDNPQDFVTVIFYEGDHTLCDDGEQIIPYPEEVVGMVALNRLIEGGPGAESGVIFVRNLKTSINYEVVLDSGAYSETVLGIFERRLNSDGGRSVNS